MSSNQFTSEKSCPSLTVVTSSSMCSHPRTSDQPVKSTESLLQRRKLPLGAVVSPLSPFFNERAKVCALERAKAREVCFSGLNMSIGDTQYRTRSTSQSSKLSETGSSTSSLLSSPSPSTESTHSIASPIGTMANETLPSTLPRISYEDWSKFGINLFTPKLLNPHSKMYYHYPSLEKKKTNLNHITGNRPRSKSSTVTGYSPPPLEDHLNSNSPINPHSATPAIQNRPHPRSPLTRFTSLRQPLERNYTR
ncbi:hypothetical protein H4Q26_014384 [Puccinia striiformis f. sp. tritici PST-130]|uniref:Uncharacterized protein n=1 Tax=Puccinia striiformis f. sp. tritici PST-78 TaxID=1165861 RepID=A0A0L0VJS3_9BASI|nr:hypothetical protein Pst134EB_023933 [Puccinia striiformis f. sp. tritici]KAI9623657.1 hypothetical protein H4Q26_014384 [Puccinia striiformis f. sp. tritici PST-130]KNE99522.1 hypothetical protein PSTG_07235 [Puccinia striiformis f. sp. tritici PST-78]